MHGEGQSRNGCPFWQVHTVTDLSDALLRHAAMVLQGCNANLTGDDDRKDLEQRYQGAVKAAKESEAR